MNGIDGSVTIVTGAGSGIGRGIALRFAREGSAVVVADLDEAAAGAVTERIVDNGGEAVAVPVDVRDDAAVQAMVETTLDEYGRLDAAINNAGILGDESPTADQTEANWDSVVETDLKGVWLCMKHEIPAMIETAEEGSIVNMSSGSGFVGTPGLSPYGASKHGVLGLTRTAALEYATDGVRVNAVCPGPIATDMTEEAGEYTERMQQAIDVTPVDRAGRPEDVAGGALWLCSDDASFVVGHALSIDGGRRAGRFTDS